MVAPGDVRPGHMTLAPDSTNLMAPVSTLKRTIMRGYLWSILSVGNQGPSRAAKNRGSLFRMTS